MRVLSSSVSSPSLVAKQRARLSAREKMTPNLDLDQDREHRLKGDVDGIQTVNTLRILSFTVNDEEGYVQNLVSDGDGGEDGSEDEREIEVVVEDKGAKSRRTNCLPQKAVISHPPTPSPCVDVIHGDDDEEDYLPLNNVVNWDEWDRTGTYLESSSSATANAQTPRRVRKRVTANYASKPAPAPALAKGQSPKLRPKYARKSAGIKRTSTSFSNNQQARKEQSSNHCHNRKLAAAAAANNAAEKLPKGAVPAAAAGAADEGNAA